MIRLLIDSFNPLEIINFIQYSFTYGITGEAAGCGGNIELSTPTYVRSPDKINNNSLDCHWYIETSEGNSINLQFENFQVENCTRSNISCSCDFVEVC